MKRQRATLTVCMTMMFLSAIARDVSAQTQLPSFKTKTEEITYLNEQLRSASEAQNAGDFNRAASILRAALAVGPEQSLLWAKLGEVYRATGDCPQAINAYKKANQIEPANAAFHNNLGQAYAKGGHVDDALSEYVIAAQLDNVNAGMYFFNMGAVLTNSKRDLEAIAAFQLVNDLTPSAADAYYLKGIDLSGFASLKNGKLVAPSGTKKALETYLQLAPTGKYADGAKQILASMGDIEGELPSGIDALAAAFRASQPLNLRRNYRAGIEAMIAVLKHSATSTSTLAWAQLASDFWSQPSVAAKLEEINAGSNSPVPNTPTSDVSPTGEALTSKKNAYEEQLKSAMELWKTKQMSGAQEATATLIKSDPSRWEGYGLAGAIEQAQNKLPEAKAAYQRALSLAPDGVKPQIAQAIQQIEADQKKP